MERNIPETCDLLALYILTPGRLIRSIRTVYKYRKCSSLSGVITSLTDLLQANYQERIRTAKAKSTGSPRREPVCRPQ